MKTLMGRIIATIQVGEFYRQLNLDYTVNGGDKLNSSRILYN